MVQATTEQADNSPRSPGQGDIKMVVGAVLWVVGNVAIGFVGSNLPDMTKLVLLAATVALMLGGLSFVAAFRSTGR
jgi:drug/metabolite transporter (DMT)-like permease